MCVSFSAGIKRYAVGDQSGWCYLSYVDVGFNGDPYLKPWADCPLGRTVRAVLFILVAACAEFALQFNESGATLVADNYYMSPLLLLCLALHKVSGYGTVKRSRIGMSGAKRFWDIVGCSLEEKGDMRFARTTAVGKEIAVIEWKDSRDVLFVSSVHIFEEDVESIAYRYAESNRADKLQCQ